MRLDEREDIIKKIVRTFSLIKCDIGAMQSINIHSLNIHAEDFFCDVFNFLNDKLDLKNANSASLNEKFIDLVDHNAKLVIQVTTTKLKSKIDNSLKILNDERYKGYRVEIFYILDKPKHLQKDTLKSYSELYGIENITEHLKDFDDLLNDIKNLSGERLLKIYQSYFRDANERYTDEITLQTVFDLLIKGCEEKTHDYSVDFRNTELSEKIKINQLNGKVSSLLMLGSEYSLPIYNIINSDDLTQLSMLIVNEFYYEVLVDNLRHSDVPMKNIINKNISELHDMASLVYDINFSKVLGDLSERIKKKTYNASFQETSVSWVIIAYFFEECFVGIKYDSSYKIN
ncbi:Uncharacterised protein [Providencia alcalifaciens]|uniref:SMEK domain-containing protein n=1 Tax=Providencia alcalifaciens DSM 30120 TaxID=520999 RepID=B6XL23_9GAMM|nr:SMEK domain-containing protein [Providencia alcalifaciens]EEB43919.1 hypothetical protein PROVALCAL_04085 [Providencia alcalifaciens DSM 30120]SQI34937.1 Uncharacterised protein [Providencia alcalifaciens]